MTTEEKFTAAVNIIRSLPKDGPYQPSHDMMLKFYGLYKQAVEGPCTEPKPSFYEVTKGYKWRAWNSLGNMSKLEAMNSYVEELKKIIETMAYTENVANFMNALGPFYEYVDLPGKKPRNNNNVKGLPENSNDPPDKDSSKSSEVEDELVANGNLPPEKMNGSPDSDSEMESDAAQSSSQNSSLQDIAVDTSDMATSSVVITERELNAAEEFEDEEELVMVSVHQESETDMITHTLELSPRVVSESDSDEEYSEPAESPDHLVTQSNTPPAVRALTPPQNDHHQESDQMSSGSPGLVSAKSTLAVLSGEVTPSDEVTYGGGNQSHPGGLQMTPRQSSQGSSYGGRSHRSSQAGGLALPAHFSSGLRFAGGNDGSGGDGGGDGRFIAEDVNAQLVTVLRRLQTDMESVLHRLNTLETLAVNQHHTLCHHCQNGSNSVNSARMEPSWWPFPELSPRSTFFLLTWPLVLHGSIKLLLLLRSRRRQR